MRLGGSLGLEWLTDLGAVREVTEALEEAGFDYLSCASHILTAAPGRFPDLPDYAYSIPYRELLVFHLGAIGFPPRLFHRLEVWPADVVRLAVEALFEQTPGPRAGAPLVASP